MANSKTSRQATKSAPPEKRPPERKIGPFANGIGVTIWLNTIDTDDGPRQVRSVTINPRRFFDRDSNTWKDAGSFYPADLPSLIFALQQALALTMPVPALEAFPVNGHVTGVDHAAPPEGEGTAF